MSNIFVAHFFMEEDKLEIVYEGTVYTQRTIVISAFFGGMFASGYMLYKNFKTFGDDKKAAQTIIFSIIGFLFILAAGFIPVLEKIPGIFFSILFTMMTSLLTGKLQGDLISKHLNADGRIYSTGNAAAVCLVNILIILAFLLGAFFLQDIATKN